MAGERQQAPWPLPKFTFSVDIEGVAKAAFSAVSGLNTEPETIEYRAESSKAFSPTRMPDLAQTGTVTLKAGTFANETAFWAWYSEMKMNTVARCTVTIILLDEGGRPTRRWTLANAWPTKISSVDMKSTGTGVAIATQEFAHEGITIQDA